MISKKRLFELGYERATFDFVEAVKARFFSSHSLMVDDYADLIRRHKAVDAWLRVMYGAEIWFSRSSKKSRESRREVWLPPSVLHAYALVQAVGPAEGAQTGSYASSRYILAVDAAYIAHREMFSGIDYHRVLDTTYRLAGAKTMLGLIKHDSGRRGERERIEHPELP